MRGIPSPNIRRTSSVVLHVATATVYNSSLRLCQNGVPRIGRNSVFNRRFVKRIIRAKGSMGGLRGNSQIMVPFIVTYNSYFFYQVRRCTTYRGAGTNGNTTLGGGRVPTPTTLFNCDRLCNNIPNKRTRCIHIPGKGIKPFGMPPLLSSSGTLFLSSVLPAT